MMNIRIAVAAHRKYQAPSDPMYLMVQAGSALNEPLGYQRDDEGENISLKNPFYSELTVFYWAVHNLDCDYLGLCHYRRYFTKGRKKGRSRFDKVLDSQQAEQLLKDCDIILPSKRNYLIGSVYQHYRNTLYIEQLDKAGEIIREDYPQYYPEFERLKVRRKAHMFNMFIMKKSVAEEYGKWLFDILAKLEKRIDISEYDDFQKRYLGRVAERLLDVYINTNHLAYKEARVISMEKVNWIRKGSAYLKAMIFKKKYTKSF